MITFGTKLSVISLIDVAAWIMPIARPIASATANNGPEITTICQNAIRKNSTLVSNPMFTKLFSYDLQTTYVETSDPTVIVQPSTSTNNNSLNGMATSIGLIIIIPKDINTEATTISITKNGKNSKNPI